MAAEQEAGTGHPWPLFDLRIRTGRLELLAFDHLGAEWATSAAFVANHASAAVSRALGYHQDGRDRSAARDLVRYRMTLDLWRSQPRPPVEVIGLEPALDMFGVSG